MQTMKNNSPLKQAALCGALAALFFTAYTVDVRVFLYLLLLSFTMLPLLYAVLAKEDFFAPIIIFSGLYGLSLAVVPLLQLAGWVKLDIAFVPYGAAFDARAALLSIVGLLLVYCAYYEGKIAHAVVSTLPVLRGTINARRMVGVIVALFLISGAGFAVLATQIQRDHFFEYFIYTNVSALGRGHIAFFATLYNVVGLLAAMGLFSARTVRRTWFLGAFALAMLLSVLSRSRGQVLLLLFVMLVCYHYRVKRLNAMKVVGAFLVMLSLVFLIAQLRRATNKNYHLTKENIASTFGGLFEEHQATAAFLSEYARTDISSTYGRTIAEISILSLIPRKIWPTKPVRYGGLDIVDAIVPNRNQGYYYAVGPFAVAYADFGYPGVAIAMLTIGFLMRVIYEWFRRNAHHDGVLLWYASFLFYLWAFQRGGFGSLPVILERTMVVVVLYLCVRTRASYSEGRSTLPSRAS